MIGERPSQIETGKPRFPDLRSPCIRLHEFQIEGAVDQPSETYDGGCRIGRTISAPISIWR